jgi:hypothetical protein
MSTYYSTYYARHREEMVARQKEYHAAHRDEYLEYMRSYYTRVLKPKRQLERQHNATRWAVKPQKTEKRRHVRHAAAPPTPKPPKPPAEPKPPKPPAEPKLKRVRAQKAPVKSCRQPGPLVTLGGPCLITWD